MRSLRFLVRCELDRQVGASPARRRDGEEVLAMLKTEIKLDESEASAPEFVRPPEEPPVYEGKEKEDGDDDDSDEG